MKRILTLLTALIVSLSLFSQITLTSSTHTPVIGKTYHYYENQSATFSIPTGGASQTWDLSGASGSFVTHNIIDPANASEPTTYPTATVALQATSGENYYSGSSTALSLLGILSTGVLRVIYTDPRDWLHFPMTYGYNATETFGGTAENIQAGQTFNRSGNNEINADGYGTLILPYGTINNVLKVTLVGNYSDTYNSIPVGSYTDTLVSFYNAYTDVEIASITVLYSNNVEYARISSYLDQADLNTGYGDVMSFNKPAMIFPNPASTHCTIIGTQVEGAVSVYDVSGQLIRNIYPNSSVQQDIDISGIGPGIYVVCFANKEGLINRKTLVIQQ